MRKQLFKSYATDKRRASSWSLTEKKALHNLAECKEKKMKHPFLITSLTISAPLLGICPAQKPVFFWDVDNVILHRTGSLTAAWHYPHKGLALHKINKELRTELADLMWHKLQGKPFAKEMIVDAARRHGNNYLAEFIITTMNAKKPIPQTVKIIQELHEAGHRQFTGSNMGKSFFDDLLKRDEMQFFKTYFDLKNSVYVTIDGLRRNIRKPRKQFYQELMDINPNIDVHDVIFIDNKKENVQAAREVGMTGILFKNPKQLQKKLTKLGFLMPNSPSKNALKQTDSTLQPVAT